MDVKIMYRVWYFQYVLADNGADYMPQFKDFDGIVEAKQFAEKCHKEHPKKEVTIVRTEIIKTLEASE